MTPEQIIEASNRVVLMIKRFVAGMPGDGLAGGWWALIIIGSIVASLLVVFHIMSRYEYYGNGYRAAMRGEVPSWDPSDRVRRHVERGFRAGLRDKRLAYERQLRYTAAIKTGAMDEPAEEKNGRLSIVIGGKR